MTKQTVFLNYQENVTSNGNTNNGNSHTPKLNRSLNVYCDHEGNDESFDSQKWFLDLGTTCHMTP
jgi:hypothetical protein